jgi:hypothetical protein
MKTKNILGLVAIVAVAVAMAFNVTVSNKKADTASLLALKNVEALAMETGNHYTGKGEKISSPISCTIVLEIWTSHYDENANNYGGGLTLSGGKSNPLWDFNANANLYGNNNNTTGSYTYTKKTVTSTITGSKIGCPGDKPSDCAPYNPCD